jgi:hypothetical protein
MDNAGGVVGEGAGVGAGVDALEHGLGKERFEWFGGDRDATLSGSSGCGTASVRPRLRPTASLAAFTD